MTGNPDTIVDDRHPSPHIARLFWQETEGAHAPVGGELNRPKPQSLLTMLKADRASYPAL